jgi:hypothetical protein
MVQELGYTSWRTAEDRLRLANALPELPKLVEAIQTGQINMTQARELARVATPETEQMWIEKAADLNVRQTEQAVSGHTKGDLPEDPIDPRLVRETMWLSVRPETRVMFRDARRALEKQRGEKLDDDAVMEALCRMLLRSGASSAHETKQSDQSTPGGGEQPEQSDQSTPGGEQAASAPYRVAVTVCSECKRGWQHGAGAVVEMTPPAVDRAICDAQWIGDINSPLVERAHQTISPAMRRKVLHRDEGRCRVPGCGAHQNLDIHHIIHLEHGGANEMQNLIALCEAHHLAHHAGTLRIGLSANGDVVFTFEGRNRFTRATREVATKDALAARGLDRDEVRAVMRRTIATVGESELNEEQWLAIALRYAK